MREIKSCEFNMDTACIDVVYKNGNVLSLYVPLIEKSLRTTVYSRSKLDLLLDSDPLEYARMVLDGTMQDYVDIFDGYYFEQKSKISVDFTPEIFMYD